MSRYQYKNNYWISDTNGHWFVYDNYGKSLENSFSTDTEAEEYIDSLELMDDESMEEVQESKSLSDYLRERVNRKLRESPSIYDERSQPNSFNLDQYLKKNGYTLGNIEFDDNGNFYDIDIEVLNKDSTHPPIFYDRMSSRFMTSLNLNSGNYSIDSLNRLQDTLNNLVSILDYLNKINLDKLEK